MGFLRVKPERNPEEPSKKDHTAKKYILCNKDANLDVRLEYNKQIHSTTTWSGHELVFPLPPSEGRNGFSTPT